MRGDDNPNYNYVFFSFFFFFFSFSFFSPTDRVKRNKPDPKNQDLRGTRQAVPTRLPKKMGLAGKTPQGGRWKRTSEASDEGRRKGGRGGGKEADKDNEEKKKKKRREGKEEEERPRGEEGE